MFCSSNNIHVAAGESRRISSASVELLLEHSGEVVIGQTLQLLSTSTTDCCPGDCVEAGGARSGAGTRGTLATSSRGAALLLAVQSMMLLYP